MLSVYMHDCAYLYAFVSGLSSREMRCYKYPIIIIITCTLEFPYCKEACTINMTSEQNFLDIYD